ncbi:MAG: 2TM domain-containing protein [Nitrososphaerales archaeon]
MAEAKLGFYIHLTVYALVNSLIFLTWCFNGGYYVWGIFPWFDFPLAFWGAGTPEDQGSQGRRTTIRGNLYCLEILFCYLAFARRLWRVKSDRSKMALTLGLDARGSRVFRDLS